MKRLMIALVCLYLVANLAIAAQSYSHDLRTFRCADADAPHGYVTLWVGDSYENPGSETCVRVGFTLESVGNNLALTVIGVPLYLFRRIAR